MSNKPPRWNAWTRVPPATKWTLMATADSEQEVRQLLYSMVWQGQRRQVFFCPAGFHPDRRAFRS